MPKSKKAMPPELIPDPDNLRVHPEENLDLIERSLREVGPFRSIGVDGENVIRAGNTIFQKAQELGLKITVVDAQPDELIAVRRSDLVGDKAKRAAIFDNAASDKSHFDALLIKDLAEKEASLLEGILSDADLVRILAQTEAESNKLIALDYDHDVSSEFSDGTQFHQDGYEVVLTLSEEQYNSEDFKAALAEFCSTHVIAYKVKSR